MVHSGHLIAGRYRLDRQVGSGGMGVVWCAVDEELGRVVAVKRAGAERDARADDQVRREARIAAGIDHPHVITVFDVVVEDGQRWLIMEYLPSRSLDGLLSERETLPPQRVAELGAQIAGALAAVHATGAVHRDVTPGNILVTDSGVAKLTDFGISRVASWGEQTVTEESLVPGTPAYLAPEVAAGADPTTASDVFSLGATLFAAVEGVPPFGTAHNSLTLLRRAAAGEVASPRHAGPLAPALAALLDPEPAARPDAHGAQDLLERVATASADTIDDAPAIRPVRSGVHRAARWRPRRTHVVFAILLVVAVGTSVGVLTTLAAPSKPHSASQTSSAADVLPVMGEAGSADPCALVDVNAVTRFGRTTFEPASGNFNRCDVLVEVPSGVLVDTKVVLEDPLPTEASVPGRQTQVGHLRVVRQDLAGDDCTRQLVLADRSLVIVDTRLAEGNGPADYCAIADAITQRAIAILNRGQIPRRPVPFDPASLAKVDACTLLDAADVDHALGTQGVSQDAAFAGWECDWNATDSDSSVEIRYDRHQPLESNAGRRLPLTGHLAYLTPDAEGNGTCLVQIVHRNFYDRTGKARVELIRLLVAGKRSTMQLCQAATKLAGSVAAKLPSA